jgi:flagellar export protein FliJ
MAKFKLEPVLRLRQHREESRKRDLAVAVAAEMERKEGVRRLARMRDEQKQTLRQVQQAGVLDMETVIQERQYVGLLDREIGLGLGVVAGAERETAVRRGRMVEAMKDRKALEVLKERSRVVERRREAAVDAAALDEMAAVQFERKRQGS